MTRLRARAAGIAAGALFVLAGWAAAAGAQTTLVLTDNSDATVRAGSYAATNYGASPILVTRASDNPEYLRRAILKFDTHNTIPAGSSITSAVLTLTVKGGNSSTRTLGAYHVTSSYDRNAITWNHRKSGLAWKTGGGDLGKLYAKATVTNVAGSKVSFDVTALVQGVVSGTFGSSRYARFALIDLGASTSGSYKEYHAYETSTTSLRPTLTVVYGGSTSTSTSTSSSSSTSTSTSTLRVYDWNIHHGVGEDGKYDLDRQATWIAKANPHVVSLNEVEKFTSWGNEDQPARFAALLKAKTGKTWYYHFAQRYKADGSKGQGNLILSVHPFAATSGLTLSHGRSVAQATISVNGRNVNIFSTHLDHESSSRRTTQIKELKSWALTFVEQRILAGDFNAWPGATEIGLVTADYYDAWAEAVKQGIAVTFPDNPNGNTRKSRIDYIFYSKKATALVLKRMEVFDTRDAKGYMASDHRPIMATFEVK